MALESRRDLLLFHFAGQTAAFPLDAVSRVTPMAQLARPPGLPSPLEGILNLAGTPVPVVRLDRLFQLESRSPGLYSMLIVLKGAADSTMPGAADSTMPGAADSTMPGAADRTMPGADDPTMPGAAGRTISGAAERTISGAAERTVALLVDRVPEVLSLPESAFVPVDALDSFNACAESSVRVRDRIVPVLSPTRILLRKERELLSAFEAMTRRRLENWAPERR